LWIKVWVFNKVTVFITLQNHLSDAITLLDVKRAVSVIEQDDPKFTLVVPVDDTGTHLDSMLYGQSRATGDACIASLRNFDSDPRGNHEPLTLVDHAVRTGVEIVARRKFCAPGR
jgi:hypothetical protein